MTQPVRMSVVVASNNARSSVRQCLAALADQRRGDDIEIIVVDNSRDGSADIVKKHFPTVTLIAAPQSALIPELWGIGMRESRGSVVAITTAHFIPAPDWADTMLQAQQAAVAAVGGAIESVETAGLVDWAVYFCRYSQYMLPFERRFVPDIAGDNASYKREHLERCRHAWRNGFWEFAVHSQLRAMGQQLLLTPAPVVYHKRSFGLRSFLWQRFWHGMHFGRERCAVLSRPRRALYLALSPTIPLVFLLRISRRVLAKRRNRTRLILALPALVLFLLSWSLGELIGYLKGPET